MKKIMGDDKIADILSNCDRDGDTLFRNVSDISKHISSYIILRKDVKINFINNFATAQFYYPSVIPDMLKMGINPFIGKFLNIMIDLYLHNFYLSHRFPAYG